MLSTVHDDILSKRTLHATITAAPQFPQPETYGVPQPTIPKELKPTFWNLTEQLRPPLIVPPMPSHWDFKSNSHPVFNVIFKILCLISLGHPDLDEVWRICQTNDEIWMSNKDRLSSRVSAITVIAGLLLGATAAFATTEPPMSSLVNYNMRGPYICIFCSFGLTLGGLIVGSAMLFVMSKCSADWFRRTLMGSRSRIYCTLWLVAYPAICTGLSTYVGAMGLLVAAWSSQESLVRGAATFVMLAPTSLLLVFMWTQIGAPSEEAQRSPSFQSKTESPSFTPDELERGSASLQLSS